MILLLNSRIIKRIVLGLIIIIFHFISFAQTSYYFGPEKIVVKLDPLTNVPERELPFDRNFFIRIYLQKEYQPLTAATLVEVREKESYNIDYRYAWNHSGMNSSGTRIYTAIQTNVLPSAGKQEYDSLIAYDIFVENPLQPKRTYDIMIARNMSKIQREACVEALFNIYKNGGSITQYARDILTKVNSKKENSGDLNLIDENELRLYYDQNVRRYIQTAPDTAKFRLLLIENLNKPIIDSAIADPRLRKKDVFFELRVISAIGITTVAYKLETRARSQVQPDFGLIFYGFGGNKFIGIADKFYGLTPYIGINYLFRQFDGDIKLSQLPRGHIKFKDLLSINVGLTLSSLSKDGHRANIFKSFNPMVGLGIRMSSAVKFNTGIIAYKRLDENPLVSDTKTQLIGYAGISIDIRLRDVLGDIGKLLTAY